MFSKRFFGEMVSAGEPTRTKSPLKRAAICRHTLAIRARKILKEKRKEMFQNFKSARTLKRFFIANNNATVCIPNVGIQKH